MHFTSDINLKYFYYQNKSYTTGTVIKLKQEYIDKHFCLYNEKLWKYATFCYKVKYNNGKQRYFFLPNGGTELHIPRGFCGSFTMDVNDLEGAIEEIYKPIAIELFPKVKKKDSESDEVMLGWVIYIAALLLSFAFREWYIIWFHGSIIFFIWRNKKLWE